MKILLLSRYDRRGASSRIRSYQYIPYLKTAGIDIETCFLFNDDYVQSIQKGRAKRALSIVSSYAARLRHMAHVKKADLVWIEKELFPWLPGWMEHLLFQMKIPYVVDYDDAIFHRYDSHPWWVIRLLLGNKIDRVMRHANLVLTGNHYLEKRAIKSGAPEVAYLPSVIDLERYTIKKHAPKSTITVGWIGSTTTAKYLKMIMPALEAVSRNHSIRMILVGAGDIDTKGLDIEVRPWHENREVQDILEFDIGLMPLPDTAWTRGKCGYKLIQYMACGLPVIASPVEANLDIVEDGINGFLASDTREWVAALEKLITRDALRKKMGKKGRQTVENKFCLQVTAPYLKRMLNKFTL
jgi:glycosyltransferase involved in cell wall biosynthesis